MNEIASPGQLRMSLTRWAIVMIPLLIVLGSISGLMSGSGADNGWYRNLVKPSFNPPGWVFGVVWPILYGLQGLALAMILDARGATGRGIAIGLFGLQFLLNLIWSPIFFARHDVSLAFWIILAMFIIATAATFCFWRIRRMAGLLMLPYLIWLCFAAFLNFSIGQLNPDAEKLHNPVARTHIGKATN